MSKNRARTGHKGSGMLLLWAVLFTLFLNVKAWGQDYSGVYYIANAIWNGDHDATNEPQHEYYWYNVNTPEYNWYLVPGADPHQVNRQDAYYSNNYSVTYGDPERPFLTTYRTNRDANSIWIVKKTGNYYYIIHALTGKYVKYEPPYITGNSGYTNNNNCHRKAVHLEAWTDPDNDPGNVFKFEITTNTNTAQSISGFNIKYTGTIPSESSHSSWTQRTKGGKRKFPQREAICLVMGLFCRSIKGTKTTETKTNWCCHSEEPLAG